MKNRVLGFLFILISVVACKKDHIDPPVAGVGPVISILSPVSGAVIANNDTLWVSADISDDEGINSIDISLKDLAGNLIWRPNASFVIGTTSFHFTDHLLNNLPDTTPCVFSISSTDQNGNASFKNVPLTMNGGSLSIQTNSSIDYSTTLEVFSEAIHICDESTITGSYGTCATITHDSIVATNNDTVTIDFGSSNCLDIDGRFRRGIIRLIYSGSYNDSMGTRQISFLNYFVNDKQVTGTENIINNGVVSNSRQYSVSINGSVIFPSYTITNSSTLIFSRYLGETTSTFADDGWNITGSTTGTDRDGRNFTAQITTPLKRIMSCYSFIITGTISVFPVNSSAQTLDYGMMVCDNSAVVTIGANNFNIILF